MTPEDGLRVSAARWEINNLLHVSKMNIPVLIGEFRRGSANACVFGNGSARRIIISSALLRILTPRELRAIVAHEIGHIAQGHLLIKSMMFYAQFFCCVLGIGLLPGVLTDLSISLAAVVPLSIAAIIGLLDGEFRAWADRRADAWALKYASRSELLLALTKLANHNEDVAIDRRRATALKGMA